MKGKGKAGNGVKRVKGGCEPQGQRRIVGRGVGRGNDNITDKREDGVSGKRE